MRFQQNSSRQIENVSLHTFPARSQEIHAGSHINNGYRIPQGCRRILTKRNPTITLSNLIGFLWKMSHFLTIKKYPLESIISDQDCDGPGSFQLQVFYCFVTNDLKVFHPHKPMNLFYEFFTDERAYLSVSLKKEFLSILFYRYRSEYYEYECLSCFR